MSFGTKSVGTIPLGTLYVGVTYAFTTTISTDWGISAYVSKPLNIYWSASQSYVFKNFTASWEITGGIQLDFDVTWQTSAYIDKLFIAEWSIAYQQEITNNAFKVAPVNRVYSPACLYSNKSPCDEDD